MEELLTLIDTRSKKTMKPSIISGKVKNVRKDNCDVEREGMPDLLKVRFHSVIGQHTDYFRITPEDGSVVLCAIIESDESEAVIFSHDRIDRLEVSIGGVEFIMKEGKFFFRNNSADLGKVLKDSFKQIMNATITTPSGPGQLSPADKQVLQQKINNLGNLFG